MRYVLHHYWGHITVLAALVVTFGLGMLLVAYHTVEEMITAEPALVVRSGEMSEISSQSFLVLDLDTGTEIISRDSTSTRPIASITKLFTAAAFRNRTNMVGTTSITWGDLNTEGESGKLGYGEVYPYHELVQAMMIESSNDAASTIYRVDEGVLESMNEYPKHFNFVTTSFADTSGLSEKNVSSAYELAHLARTLWQDQPHLFDVSNQKQIIGTHTGWINNNPFVGMEGYRGGKHGFTYESNRTSVAVFEENISGAKRDFIYVMLGSDDLVSDIEQLRSYVQNNVTYK